MTDLLMEAQMAEIRERDRRDHHMMELSGAQTAAAYRDDGHGGWRDSHYDRHNLLAHIDAQAARIAELEQRLAVVRASCQGMRNGAKDIHSDAVRTLVNDLASNVEEAAGDKA